jgi:predicted component of type VI protein secretion system
MFTRYLNHALVAIAALCVAGCSSSQGSKTVVRRVGCAEASANAVANGKSNASAFARANLRYQIQDLKGFMITDGYAQVAVASQQVACRNYPLAFGATGLTQCTATARLCSR